MPYYDGEDIPGDIVYSFKDDCEAGNIENLNSYFPPNVIPLIPKPNFYQRLIQFIFKKRVHIKEHENKISHWQYNYAFWFGLSGAARGNQIEVFYYLINNPYLKEHIEAKNIERIIRSYEPGSDNDLDHVVFDGPSVASIDVSLPLIVSAHLCHFEIFELLKKTDLNKYINCDYILMECFNELDDSKFEKLKQIENIEEIIKENYYRAFQCCIKNENNYGLVKLIEYFKVPIESLRDEKKEPVFFAKYKSQILSVLLDYELKNKPAIIKKIIKI